jgi:hypothetical protein
MSWPWRSQDLAILSQIGDGGHMKVPAIPELKGLGGLPSCCGSKGRGLMVNDKADCSSLLEL